MQFDPYRHPERTLPEFIPNAHELLLQRILMDALRTGQFSSDDLRNAFLQSRFNSPCVRVVLVLYAAAHKRILVTRAVANVADGFIEAFGRLLDHERRRLLASAHFRLQLDFVEEAPVAVDFYQIGMELKDERHFEIGIDGLLFQGEDNKLQIFLPGDAYVRSVMGMGQLREYLGRAHGDEYLRTAGFQRFRSLSYISTGSGWRRLYRGHPVVGPATREKVEQALALAVEHIKLTQEPNGKFLYYYDAALNSRRDHEHPRRDPKKNPYYNILRHGGGALTCLYHEKYTGKGDTWEHIRRAIDYLLSHARRQDYAGQEGAYIYSEKKSKLGGAGIALYLLAQYQRSTGDTRYRVWSDRLACHLSNQITASGEFIYYNIYLDQPITEADNPQYFSFFYPGEAICGLAAYLHLLTETERAGWVDKIRKALEFLLVVRPATRASEYSAVPSDGWLMMGIMELWDFAELRHPLYSDFVFSDAKKMIDHMYRIDDAPYPDYAGAFYYEHGDYPYADGARCEGLLGAYELAVKMNNQEQSQFLRPAIDLATWALLHLVNTEDAIYFATNPKIALGGIRFKYTRQWFRIDTIQHVASFFAKLLPYWPERVAAVPADGLQQ